jgi:hypothetical protein
VPHVCPVLKEEACDVVNWSDQIVAAMGRGKTEPKYILLRKSCRSTIVQIPSVRLKNVRHSIFYPMSSIAAWISVMIVPVIPLHAAVLLEMFRVHFLQKLSEKG